MQDIENFLNYGIFFNLLSTEKEKEEVVGLVRETCERIEEKNHGDMVVVLGNIEYIVYKKIIDNYGEHYGGETGPLIFKNYCKCFIVYFSPLAVARSRNKQLFALAHEFAHAYFGHPFESDQTSTQKEEREKQAQQKAIEWGFIEE